MQTVPPCPATIWRPSSPLVIHSDFPLPAGVMLLDELTAQRRELGRRLGLPAAGETVQIYLFDGAERFREFIRARHPDFPDRRAFFVDSDRESAVYAQWGDRMVVDLRHELTHAYLHSVVPSVPLWLDEGLAKYFELPSGRHGLNRQYVRQIAAAMQRGGMASRPPPLGAARSGGRHEPGGLRRGVGVGPLLAGIAAGLQGRAVPVPGRAARPRQGGAVVGPLDGLGGHPEWELSEHVRQLAAVVPPETPGGVRK